MIHSHDGLEDLVSELDTELMFEEGPPPFYRMTDNRPMIQCPQSTSYGRMRRAIGWYDDSITQTGSTQLCLRVEVEVKKVGRKAGHKLGDIVIWSIAHAALQSNPDVLRTLEDALGVAGLAKTVKDARARIKRKKDAEPEIVVDDRGHIHYSTHKFKDSVEAVARADNNQEYV